MKIRWWYGFLFALSTASFAADSTKITPPKNVTSYYPEVTSVPPTVLNEGYNQLPKCPTIANCADINTIGGNQSTCPDYCKVTRIPDIPIPDANGRINTTVTDAICPAGYTAVGSFNVQPELLFNQNPPIKTPIYGMDEYNTLTQINHWTCWGSGPRLQSNIYCSPAGFSPGTPTDFMSGDTGIVVYVDQLSAGGGCHNPNNCSQNAACIPNPVQGQPPTNSNYFYYFYEMSCQPPPGVYIGTNKTPISLVCARAKTTWKPLNAQ